MNCEKVAFWRAWIDRDSPISSEDRRAASDHLAGCAQCQEIIDGLKANQALVGASLSVEDGRSATAWAGFARSIEAAPKTKRSHAGWRPAIGVAAVCLVLLTSVALPPVRTLAAEFLQLFRAEKFEAIKIDPQAMADFNPEKLGKFTMSQPEPRPVADIEEAAKVTGLDIKEPGNLPAGIKRAVIGANRAGKVSLTFDLKKFLDYLKANKIEGINLPPELDGKTITGHIPPLVMMEYSQGGVDQNASHRQPEIVVFQAGLPSLEAPAGFEADAIRDELLKLPVIPAAVKDQLKAMTDWKKTLPIPYPGNEATSEKVKVGKDDGLFFNANDGTKVLIWTDGKMTFGLVSPENGPISRSELFSIAGTLK